MKSNDVENFGTREYTYDENGNMLTSTKDDANGVFLDKHVYSYVDGKTNTVHVYEDDLDNLIDIEYWGYTEDGHLAKRTVECQYDHNLFHMNASYEIEYDYSSDERLPAGVSLSYQKTHERRPLAIRAFKSGYGIWETVYEAIYEYNADGTITVTGYNHTVGSTSFDFDYKYNADGVLLYSEKVYFRNGNRRVVVESDGIKETTTNYDGDGNVTSQEVKELDEQGNLIYSSTDGVEYTYENTYIEIEVEG